MANQIFFLVFIMEKNHSLTNHFYYGQDKFLLAVDCIIFGFDEQQLKLLLFKRAVEPLRGRWSLVGSFVKKEEDLDQAARRVLEELTGLQNVFMTQLHSFGEVNRDSGARVVSISYTALIRIQDYDEQLVGSHGASWFPIKEIPKLILDHARMVKLALERLQYNARHQPLGFELLPEKFTLPQLIQLYEEIFAKKIDDRNFRKKILSTGLLKKLNQKDKSASKKGAFLYQFDIKKYKQLINSGFSFEL